jgi:hypothetical protein
MSTDLADHARHLLEVNDYLTLGTADAHGLPWTSPVFFSSTEQWEFYWTSATDARHSRNLAARQDVSLVVFDSSVPPFHGRAVYAVGVARALTDDELERGLEVYPGPESRGAAGITRADVAPPSPYRLYRATASDVWVLCPRDPRRPCALHGRNQDHRTRVV